ncbi:hypothetical protein F5888DRAFT_1908553 [Russula emetica]|nr:hypothetical protein F5888DRAFT_1908553 [Russula emetica]
MSRLHPSPTPTHSPSMRPTQTVRADEYARSRGGSAPVILSVLSQLHVDKCWLIASLGGAQEARALARELEAEVRDSNSQLVINHNPLPDIPHEEFVSLLGPLLVPEHYPSPESPLASPPFSLPPPSPITSVPSDWIHFEGRSVKTTLNNLQGLDGLACERRWRSQCVFSVDLPPDDMVHTRAANPPRRRSLPQLTLRPSTIPRICERASWLLACAHASRALLVAYWGADGAAALSVPTRECFESSGWSTDAVPFSFVPSSFLPALLL